MIGGLLAAGGMVMGLAACHASDSIGESTAAPLPTRTLLPPTATVPAPQVTPSPVPTDLPGPSALLAQTPQVALDGSNELPAGALAQIDRATQDWAAQLDVDPAEIHLVGLESFRWPDRFLGCKTLEEQYGPAPREPVNGYRVVLEYADQIKVYHTDETSGIVQCADPIWLAQEGHPITVDPIAKSIVDRARADAGRRLALPSEQVQVVSVLTVNWPDSSLGCPQPGIEYEPITTRGYRLVFEAGSTRLIYHTSIQYVVMCTPDEEILPGALRQALPSATPEPTPGA